MTDVAAPAPSANAPSKNAGEDATGVARLLAIMARLRDPENGCAWDREQTFATIAPYTVEEAYEVAAAIEDGDMAGLKDELGDLLLQVVFHAQMAKEDGLFAFEDVAEALAEKLVRRHPHVFGDASVMSADEVHAVWDAAKDAERADKPAQGVLDDVPYALPALLRAFKISKRAARVGFDWPDAASVRAKLNEELAELEEAVAQDEGPERIAEEFGDALSAMVTMGRKLGVEPEDALRRANAKFVRRFRAIEAGLAEDGRAPQDATLNEMEALWARAKAAEKGA